MKAKKKNLFSTFLKIGITVLLLYLVFTRIPFVEIWSTVKQLNIVYLILALVLFIISQWVSAHRLLILFNTAELFLNPKSNYILYLLGMFYNFFIPGGIGGDAYKIYVLNKKFDWSLKKLTAAIFVDRFMGLTAIGILMLCFSFFIPYFTEKKLLWVIAILLIVGFLFSYFVIKKWFHLFLSAYRKTVLLSIGVQILQCASLLSLLASISNLDNSLFYVVVFLMSSALSIFSFSGIGIREIIFYHASDMFHFDSTIAVTIGLLFSTITALVSLFGIIFHFKTVGSFIKQYSAPKNRVSLNS